MSSLTKDCLVWDLDKNRLNIPLWEEQSSARNPTLRIQAQTFSHLQLSFMINFHQLDKPSNQMVLAAKKGWMAINHYVLSLEISSHR